MTSSEIKFVPKGWGHEKWIVNTDEYCGKLLFFEEGKRCSWHYHKIKDETFYLQSGKLLLYYGDTDSLEGAKDIVLTPGDKFHIYRGLRHQMIAIEPSELFEFSTQHFDEDSYQSLPLYRQCNSHQRVYLRIIDDTYIPTNLVVSL